MYNSRLISVLRSSLRHAPLPERPSVPRRATPPCNPPCNPFLTPSPPWKPNASTPSPTRSPVSRPARPSCGGIFDFDAKETRLAIVSRELEDPNVWNDAKRAQDLGKEKKALDDVVVRLSGVGNALRDAEDLFALAREEDDADTLAAVEGDVQKIEATVADMEFRRMFADPLDPANCFIVIQAGSGGTEAQDWAQMLERNNCFCRFFNGK